MLICWYWYGQSTDRAGVPLRPLESLAVQLLILELCCTLFAFRLVLLPVGPLAVHAAVLDEAAGRAALELDDIAHLLAAVGAGFDAIVQDGHAFHHVLLFRRRRRREGRRARLR